MVSVSVLIPVYNVENWLAECLDSIVGQTYRNLEIICVNDGSTDSSPAILSRYAERDDRIKIINQKNAGLSAARNSAMDAATGKYIYFIDSDDILALDAIEKLVEKAEAGKLDVLLFDADIFCENGAADDGFNYIRSKEYSDITTGTELMAKLVEALEYRSSVCIALWRRDYIDGMKLRYLPRILHEDNAFTFKALLHAERASHINERFYKRRYRDNSIMTSVHNTANATGLFVAFIDMLNEYSDADVPDVWRKDVEQIMSNVLFNSIKEYMPLTAVQKSELDWRGYNVEGVLFDVTVKRLWNLYMSPEAIEVRKKPIADAALEKKLKRELAARRGMLDSVRGSLSFRLGRLATFPARGLRVLVRAYRAGGVRGMLDAFRTKLSGLMRRGEENGTRKPVTYRKKLYVAMAGFRSDSEQLRAEISRLTEANLAQADELSRLSDVVSALVSDMSREKKHMAELRSALGGEEGSDA